MNAWIGNRPPLICLLGECRIGDDVRPQRLAYRKGWALLAWLAVERTRAHRRSQIAAMLWPELAQQAALTNLRQVLRDLNRALIAAVGEGVLLVDRETVRLCPQASQGLLDIDLLGPDYRGLPLGGVAMTQRWLFGAGDLLEGMEVEGCEEFGEWLAGMRGWIRQSLLKALERACSDALAAGEMETAVALVRRHVALDPWDEAQQRLLMQLLREVGEPRLALEGYRALERSLQRELGVEPEPATQILALEIGQQAGVGAGRPAWPLPVAETARKW